MPHCMPVGLHTSLPLLAITFFTDPFLWSGDNSFTSDKSNYVIITEYEEFSENINSAESWKTYRRWRQQIKREFMNASDRPQARTLSDSSPELMPSLGSNKMPPRPKEIVAAHEKYNNTENFHLLKTLEDTAIASSRVGKWIQFAWLS